MSRRPLWTHPLVPTVLALAALAVDILGDHGVQPLRIAAMVGFLTLAPGLASIRLIMPRGTASDALAAMVAVGISLTVGVLVAQLMIWTHIWWPRVGVVVIVALTLALVAVDVRRPVDRPSVT